MHHCDARRGTLEALLLDTSGLANPVSQVVELCPTDVTTSNDGDGLNDRRMQRKNALNANAEADLSYVESCSSPMAAASAYDNALESLDTFAPTFDNPDIDANRVSWGEDRNVVAQLCIFDLFDRVHGILRNETMRCRTAILAQPQPYRPTQG